MYLFSLLNMNIQLFVYDNLFSELYFGCHCPCGTHLSGSFLTSVLTLMCICGCIWGLCCRGYKCIGFLPDFPGAWWSGSCVCGSVVVSLHVWAIGQSHTDGVLCGVPRSFVWNSIHIFYDLDCCFFCSTFHFLFLCFPYFSHASAIVVWML